MSVLKNINNIIVCGLCILLLSGCKKYLDAKSDKSLVTPSSLADLQSILDYYFWVNQRDPGAGLLSSEDYYLSQSDFDGLGSLYNQNLYIWNPSNLFASGTNDWSRAYDNVYRANTILENISSIPIDTENNVEWNNVYGQALFLRAKAFFQIAVIWAKVFDSSTASTDLGIPLRLKSDFNEISTRSTLQETYDQIIADAKSATEKLPDIPLHVLRSSKMASNGLLARIYLSLGNYDSCLYYCQAALAIKSELLDYNELSQTATYPIANFNKEVMYGAQITSSYSVTSKQVDSSLYKSYDDNDLRKAIFFRSKGNGSYSFKGGYTGSSTPFSGIATDEMYLMRAECNARLNQLQKSMDDLNNLLSKRWKTGTFIPYNNLSKDTLLYIILLERRKELLFRDIRWLDIKRLNRNGDNIILTRFINDKLYSLSANDLRYALAIPEDVIQLSGMPQNPR
ncbi:RagB/SusD family nutrient uptake outer membrane protein [Rhizosphaericola mali]|uniref:RagB/SusD family nutrient uptake outer membrane protein n=1 Tax=Rhizosphaericola mali TaxID=2545455 RepID=A0A5P2G440_9BACT|nr:RagB/SusD family nutrient uptake outer membrane protein [Rhizosphaericola mali]QES88909.1 RagB/SusD family nutrient uptake outer membrane protein [Rhizosphaericola mali]